MNGTVTRRMAACCLALVTAAAGCYRPDDYLLGPSQADEVLVVTASATTVSADGISRVTITAQLDPRTDADKRILTFTTTAGTLSYGGGRKACRSRLRPTPVGRPWSSCAAQPRRARPNSR